MLKSFTIKNFKSFKDATLELSPFTLMIGANASGKSNALEALRILSLILSTGELQANENFDYIRVRDIQNILFGKKKQNFMYTSHFLNEDSTKSLTFSTRNIWNDIILQDIKYIVDNKIMQAYEKISMNMRHFIHFKRNYQNIKDYDFLEKCFEVVKTALYLDLYTEKLREYSKNNNSLRITSTGENVSSTIYNLCKDTTATNKTNIFHSTETKFRSKTSKFYNKTNKEIILDTIRSLPEQNFTDIDFIHVEERNEVMLKLEESFGQNKSFYHAGLLSDGTLRVLAIVAFLLSAREGQMLMIEDIDNGIHPSRIKDFMQKIHAIATDRQLQVIMPTHNPALLDAVPNESLEDVVCCYRDKDEGDSRFVRLGDLYLYPELIAQGSLGDLVTQGVVEKYVQDKRTEDEIVQDRLDWLEDFQRRQKEVYDEEK